MAKYTLRNLTNGPQMVAGLRVDARGSTEPIELSDFDATLISRTGIFRLNVVSENAPAPKKAKAKKAGARNG